MTSSRLFKFVPNLLSLSRIAFCCFLPWIPRDFGARGLFFFVLCVTDFLDGMLARRLSAVSRLGTLLDAIGDKLIVLVAVATVVLEHRLSLFHAFLFFTREYSLVAFFLWMKVQRRWERWKIQSFFIGKWVTAVQFGLLVLLFFGRSPPPSWYIALGVVGALSFFELLFRARGQVLDNAAAGDCIPFSRR